MILWIVLFLLVVGISLVLAYRSMKDFQEIPQKSRAEYGLFLVRRTQNFNAEFLNSIRKQMSAADLIIGIERLFKGSQAALALFGPKNILDRYSGELNFLELEDYALNLDSKDCLVWEAGVKKAGDTGSSGNIFKNLTRLGEEDRFFWQVVLGAEGRAEFKTQIRAVLFSKDTKRRKELAILLQNSPGGLFRIPRPFGTEQMMDFFRLRSLSKDSKGPVLSAEGIISLLKV